MNLELRDHVAVVFGAASGIGRAIAEGFAAEGGRVALLDRDHRVNAVATEIIGSAKVQAISSVIDVTDYAAVKSAGDVIASSLGPIRHVVFAVGTGSGKFGFPFWQVPASDWQRVLDVNLIAAVNVAHVFGPLLAEQRQGTMLFLSSVAGQIGSQTDPPYSAAKAGLINFAQVAAKDLAPFGVRVNVISPGMVQTPLNRSVWQAWNDRQPLEDKRSYDDWATEKVKKVAPLGRWQTPEEMAATAVFLASDRAQNITGQTINVDGGQVMHS